MRSSTLPADWQSATHYTGWRATGGESGWQRKRPQTQGWVADEVSCMHTCLGRAKGRKRELSYITHLCCTHVLMRCCSCVGEWLAQRDSKPKFKGWNLFRPTQGQVWTKVVS